MKKFSLAVLLTLFPLLALADGSLSFAPPASDFSVVFLGNIFGIVDGVLHGTGSQIMGNMFAVFNAAVLALGGMIIMYTLIVSTMNTAHQGEMLGQKWSSIWIPIRSTIGLALLIPKASGYCLMQIFVMWIVVQGVGAADKVWEAALSYLNRGGVIIQGQMDPTKNMLSGGASAVATGAQTILAGQVCMLGLQTLLQNQRESYITQQGASSPSGPCAGTPSDQMKTFCTSAVPNFISTVNVVDVQRNTPSTQTELSVDMPNFAPTSPYSSLKGICGTISWNIFPSLSDVSKNIPSVSKSDLDTASLSRVIAIQQMYMDLSSVAQVMVGNNPGLASNQSNPNKNDFSPVAVQQFGVPQTAGGSICTDSNTAGCSVWGAASGGTGAPLFNGSEFQGVVQDYNGIMLPTLTLMTQAQNANSAQASRKFIQDATSQGWIMAGSYFFDLITLNVEGSQAGDTTDSNTGLDKSVFDAQQMLSPFGSGESTACDPSKPYSKLCVWLNGNVTGVNSIVQLINNGGSITPPNLSQSRNVIDGSGSSTVYGFTNNASILQLPGQPGQQTLDFDQQISVPYTVSELVMPSVHFPCGSILGACVGRFMGDVFYNYIFKNVFNAFLMIITKVVDEVMKIFLIYPLLGMATIFRKGLTMISTPGVNPIVALAQMGTYYINFASNLWMSLIALSITTSLIPIFGVFIFAFLTLFLPILLAWLGIMMGIGFTTAYYVPILPYMIFTFGSIAWLMAVIESMVAAPIVALGITHPEGHDAFGKGEQAIMILLNVFLRPAMMIIGYIAAIALSYVSVWIINAGFNNAIGFIQGNAAYGTAGSQSTIPPGGISGGYTSWAGTFAFFFSILIYTMMYLTVVTKAFTLISVLPDKVLRWIGGTPESYGADTAGWTEDTKGKISEAGKDSQAGQEQMSKQMAGYATQAIGKAKGGKDGGKAEGKGSTSDKGGGGDDGGGGAAGGGAEGAAGGAEAAAAG